ncbi:S1C family serine protease [Ornithinimicrobium pekingense]|uniref:Serine protease n=2 Tax=Ornithinimicrobium pekingense TaxID=384677 RepID=A0ABQ2F9T0_9MICO|nr:trypsin-like peptidase domain-containing protein [Ornithinimicrobium pekingense]GGK73325.1 serine protease [Ornithinimicrobium pekingense]
MSMDVLQALEDTARTTLERVGPSVVSIGRSGRGTGYVVGEGRVLTNAHNLRDRTTQVGFTDGRRVQGNVVGSDLDGDLVVLDVDTGDAPALVWGADAARTGDVVLSVTAGGHLLRVTWGQVTGVERGFRGPRGRPVHGALEHTAPAARGSSGAPLLDRAGGVVGVSTHRLEHGFYLARAADAALQEAVAGMQQGRRLEPVRLGVALAPSDVARRLRQAVGLADREGVLVRTVVDGSPADAAGLAVGDLLVGAGGRALHTPDDLIAVLDGLRPGDELRIEVIRGESPTEVTVRFEADDGS